MILLTTPRLTLRAPTSEDIEGYLRLNRDPEVTRFVGTHLSSEREGIATWIQDLAVRFPSGSERGVWAAEHLGEFAGSFMLRPARDTGELELGYRLLPKFWGKGLAAEAVHAMLALASGERVVVRAHAQNAPSIALMKRVGMKFVREYDWNGEPSVEFALESKSTQNGTET